MFYPRSVGGDEVAPAVYIEAVGEFLQLPPVHQVKTMAYMAVNPAPKAGQPEITKPVVVLLRGDHMLNEAKLAGFASTCFV